MVNGWSKQFREICHTLGCVQKRLGGVYEKCGKVNVKKTG